MYIRLWREFVDAFKTMSNCAEGLYDPVRVCFMLYEDSCGFEKEFVRILDVGGMWRGWQGLFRVLDVVYGDADIRPPNLQWTPTSWNRDMDVG